MQTETKREEKRERPEQRQLQELTQMGLMDFLNASTIHIGKYIWKDVRHFPDSQRGFIQVTFFTCISR